MGSTYLVAARVEADVARFHIAVHEPPIVCMTQGGQDVAKEAASVGFCQSSAGLRLYVLLQIWPFVLLHHYVHGIDELDDLAHVLRSHQEGRETRE